MNDRYDTITGNHRLVGWGGYDTMKESVLPRVFGYLVRAATLVVKEYHGDLFLDAEWLRREFDRAFAENAMFRFMVCVRHSGTNLGDMARVMFDSLAYDAALYMFEVQVDGRGEWTLSIDLIDSRPDRPDRPAEPSLPESHRRVLDKCEAEAWRNVEQGDALTEADVAADIIQHLTVEYDF